jgi:hypothetical protein
LAAFVERALAAFDQKISRQKSRLLAAFVERALAAFDQKNYIRAA